VTSSFQAQGSLHRGAPFLIELINIIPISPLRIGILKTRGICGIMMYKKYRKVQEEVEHGNHGPGDEERVPPEVEGGQ
jgi:hypothetical protein